MNEAPPHDLRPDGPDISLSPRPLRSGQKSRDHSTLPQIYAAIDLGTNNCRMMIASFDNGHFTIIDTFSKIVRLGEDLSRTGQLSMRAQDRAIQALKSCADRLARKKGVKLKAVATQACRIAKNGKAFIARIKRETGIEMRIITPQEEAQLSVISCASLVDEPAKAAIIMDVGGGSTEISWLDLSQVKIPEKKPDSKNVLRHGERSHNSQILRPPKLSLRPTYWISIPKGVVNLAERFPEPDHNLAPDAYKSAQLDWFAAMVEDVRSNLIGFSAPEALRSAFLSDKAYIIGTSGAITSLAGLHLGLERYDRNRVDGLWMSKSDCERVIEHLLEIGALGRRLEPCIGKDRADLVLAGAAILVALQSLWPTERLRVADRGLREGLLMSMIKKKKNRRRKRRTPNLVNPITSAHDATAQDLQIRAL